MKKLIIALCILLATTSVEARGLMMVGGGVAAVAGCTWQTAMDVTTGSGNDNWPANYGQRLYIPAETAQYDGTKIRITMYGGPTTGLKMAGVGICASPDTSYVGAGTFDCSAAVTRVTCGASNACNAAANGNTVSDEITYTYNHAVGHVITGWNSEAMDTQKRTGTALAFAYKDEVADTSQVADWTPASVSNGEALDFMKLEVCVP